MPGIRAACLLFGDQPDKDGDRGGILEITEGIDGRAADIGVGMHLGDPGQDGKGFRR